MTNFLTDQWLILKGIIDAAQDAKNAIEAEILKNYDIKESGTTHIEDVLTIQTGTNDSWDQVSLMALYALHKGGAISKWPFKEQWAPDTKVLSALKEIAPEDYEFIANAALTVKPKKPYFSIKKAKGE